MCQAVHHGTKGKKKENGSDFLMSPREGMATFVAIGSDRGSVSCRRGHVHVRSVGPESLGSGDVLSGYLVDPS